MLYHTDSSLTRTEFTPAQTAISAGCRVSESPTAPLARPSSQLNPAMRYRVLAAAPKTSVALSLRNDPEWPGLIPLSAVDENITWLTASFDPEEKRRVLFPVNRSQLNGGTDGFAKSMPVIVPNVQWATAYVPEGLDSKCGTQVHGEN